MAYYITATSERGKPVTKYGGEYIRIDVEKDRRYQYSLIIDGAGLTYADRHYTGPLEEGWNETGTEAAQ